LSLHIGDRVRFQIRDAYYPDADAILRGLYGADVLEGILIGITDSGDERSVFAVLHVEALPDRIIVPMHSVRQARVNP
jgi:hypothetical protein